MPVEAQVSKQRQKPGTGYGMNSCCPAGGDGTQVSSSYTVPVWVTICSDTPPYPGDVYVQVVPIPPATSPVASSAKSANTRIPLDGNCYLYLFDPVPGAASAPHPITSPNNTLIVSYPNSTPETVSFTGYSDYGCDCGSGPGQESGSGCAASGYGASILAPQLSFPAAFEIEISGLKGGLAIWNSVHTVKCSHPPSLNWDNASDTKSHHRVAMKHCARTQTFTLTIHWQDKGLSARAPITVPFAPLIFELPDMPRQSRPWWYALLPSPWRPQRRKARIVATGVRG